MNRKINSTKFTARQFAAVMKVPYDTIIYWLRRGWVPGAKMVQTPVGSYWEIPARALQMEKPKRGRPRKEEKKR